jgi:hypothetical protein
MVDPIWADDNDNYANTFSTISICDYNGRSIRNYRYSAAIAADSGNTPQGAPWSCQGGGCIVTATGAIGIEYGGGYTTPGKPYMGFCGNVP